MTQQKEDFAHLHLHTSFSMLDGASRISELIKHVKSNNMSSVAITDHGNMFGSIELYDEAKKEGIKPILGNEFYVSSNRKKESEEMKIADGNAYHLVILAKNQVGYQNLMSLSSKSYTEGFYKKPRIDYELLSKYSEGLICLTACISGEVNRRILEGKQKEASKLAGKLNEIFRKEDFYLEIQNHNLKEEKIVAEGAYEISKKNNIPLVLTNDSHFLTKEDREAQDILLRIGIQKKISEPLEFGFNSEFYVKSPKEMKLLYPELPEAFYNTLEISNKINLNLEFGNHLLPEFLIPKGYNAHTYLEELVWKGIQKKYTVDDNIKNRVNFELKTIQVMGFAGYFLIVQDYINFAKKRKIPVGPGRGSAAGSIVAYALDITNVDPLKYNLLFERFLNPDRKDMPDIDTDFCVEKREEVINYIREKYGKDKVGQIITFNSLAAKAALKDVARVLEMNFSEANDISKAFPQKLGISIEEALETSEELRNIYNKNELNQKIFNIAKRLEGNYRQPGRHAAGVVISSKSLEEVVPLSTVSEKGQKERAIVTQYSKDQLEKIGLIKMDILGLKNLTTIQNAVQIIKEKQNIVIDLENLPLNDDKTYNFLKKANTLGIFQLESTGITDLVAKAQINSFEEIVALIALYRPGPMSDGALDLYLDRKSGKSKVQYSHPLCEPILKETFGIPIYQEQVMSISRVLGNFTAGQSDSLRKAMAKKKPEVIEELKDKFIEGAKKNDIDIKISSKIFEQLEKFGGYGFNKSHSVAYALITYQTAYLKCNFPTEYMTALLNSSQFKTSDIVKYINNAKDMNIDILNPDINESEADFSVIENNKIRFGISCMKGIGKNAAFEILEKRKKIKKFRDLENFVLETHYTYINKRILETLIKSGSLDSMGYTRKCLYESIDSILNFKSKFREEENNASDLFSSLSNSEDFKQKIIFNKHENEWSLEEKLQNEKEIVGIYLTAHPLDSYVDSLQELNIQNIEKIIEMKSGVEIEIAGIINEKNIKLTKKENKEWCNFKVEDRTGEIDCNIFPNLYKKFKDIIKEDNVIFLKGELEKIEIGESELKGNIKVSSLEQLNENSITERLEKSIHIKIENEINSKKIIQDLKNLFLSYKGNSNIYFHINNKNEKKVIKAHSNYRVALEKNFLDKLNKIIDKNSFFLHKEKKESNI